MIELAVTLGSDGHQAVAKAISSIDGVTGVRARLLCPECLAPAHFEQMDIFKWFSCFFENHRSDALYRYICSQMEGLTGILLEDHEDFDTEEWINRVSPEQQHSVWIDAVSRYCLVGT